MSKIGIEMGSRWDQLRMRWTEMRLSCRSHRLPDLVAPLLPQSFPSTCPLPSHRPLSPRQVPREPDRPARPLIFEARWHLVGISSHCDKYFPTHHHATNPFHDNTPFAPPSPTSRPCHTHRITIQRNSPQPSFTMADQLQEILDVPREFLREGIQFISKSQKRE